MKSRSVLLGGTIVGAVKDLYELGKTSYDGYSAFIETFAIADEHFLRSSFYRATSIVDATLNWEGSQNYIK